MSLLFLIGRQMKDEMRAGQKKGDNCSWLHFEALRYVEDAGKPTMRNVADYFSMTPPAATLLIEGLVANNLMRRAVDSKDRRTVRVALAPKGRQVLDAAYGRA